MGNKIDLDLNINIIHDLKEGSLLKLPGNNGMNLKPELEALKQSLKAGGNRTKVLSIS